MPTMSRAISRRTHRTFAGRVVYDRPKHYFKLQDAIRILERLDWSKVSPSDLSASVAQLQKLYLQVLTRSLERVGIDTSLLLTVGQFAIDLLWKVRNAVGEAFKWVWDGLRDLVRILLD